MRSLPTVVVLTLMIGGAASAGALAGAGNSLAATPRVRPFELQRSFYAASVRATRAARHLISFETRTDSNPATAFAYVAAAQAASDALVTVAGQPGGRCAIDRVYSVVVAAGAPSSAKLSAGRLTLVITPLVGVDGVPSTEEIARAVRSASCA